MILISGYEVDDHWKNVANGRYSFAVKARNKYFIKEFGRPKYPRKDMCSPDTYSRLESECKKWEKNRKKIISGLQKAASRCRYIVAPVELLLEKNKYYVISERIEEKPLELEEICVLSKEDKLLIMKKFMEALKELESEGIVHGDLKPPNIFVIKTPEGYEPRLMDFDDSYFSGNPPLPDETVGSMEYYSPELGKYVRSEGDASDITCKSDIFATGVIFHEYITSKKVRCHNFKYPCQTTRAVDILLEKFPPDQMYLHPLVKSMLEMDYKKRPSCDDILSKFGSMVVGKSHSPPTDPKPKHKPVPVPPDKGRSELVTPDGYKFKKYDDSSYIVTYPDGHKCIMASGRAIKYAEDHGLSLEDGSIIETKLPKGPMMSDKAAVLEVLEGGKRYKIRHKNGSIAIIPAYVYESMVKKGQIE